MLRRVHRGEADAFTELLERYRRPLLNYAYRLLGGDAAAAADVAQEAFVRAYQHAGAFDPGRGTVRAWLFTLARRRALDELRRRRRHQTVPLESAPAPLSAADPGAAEQMAASETGREIATAVASLPEDQRTAVILSEYHGLAHGEIAAVLGCSAKSVESRLYRARQTLRGKLGHLLG